MNPLLLQSGLAFAEGFALILSPCILPVLPLVLAGGVSGSPWRPVGIMLGFVLSFAAFALVLRGVLAAAGVPQDLVWTTSYLLLGLFGLTMLIPALDEKFSGLAQGMANTAQSVRTGAGFGGGIVLGALLGMIWAPCGGPILAAALVQVAQARTGLETGIVIGMFALGSVLPMAGIAILGRNLVNALAGYTTAIKRVMGAVLMIFAGLGAFGFNPALFIDEAPQMTQIDDSYGLLKGLEKSYKAPEVVGIHHWVNSTPTKLADLKGKVVLVDFWTYSCINCVRTLPHLRAWYERYHDEGFEIIGVHAPEFAFEKKLENVEAAIQKYQLRWPVALDNDFKTWDSYKNRFWPAHYLIDKNGQVVYEHFGEGSYDVTEHNIRHLLGTGGDKAVQNVAAPYSAEQTHELYLGSLRGKMWEGGADALALPLHNWVLDGEWIQTSEFIQSGAAGDTLKLHFAAKKVHLVMATASEIPVDVEIKVITPAGTQIQNLTVRDSQLYTLAELPAFTEGRVEIRAASPTLRAYAFTFGS